MKRLASLLAAAAVGLALWAPAAQAEFGLADPQVTFSEADGSPATQAGAHPYAMTTSFSLNTKTSGGVKVVDGALRDLHVVVPEGLVGNPTAVPRCATIDFLQSDGGSRTECADSTAVGVVSGNLGGGLGIPGPFGPYPVHSLEPAPGVAAKLGFWISDVPVTINVTALPDPPYNIVASLRNTSQLVEVFDSSTTLWGNPAAEAHDEDRGACAIEGVAGPCPASVPERPFLTLPRYCDEPLFTFLEATSWWTGDPLKPSPGTTVQEVAESPPLGGCANLNFSAQMAAAATTQSAESPSGLDLRFSVRDEGIADPGGVAHSDIEDIVVALPEGMTLNPSAAEGLGTCSLGQLAAETAFSAPGEGCPGASKVGTVEAETPVLEGEVLRGSLYVAVQDDPATREEGVENPFDSLLALYVVIRDPELGLVFRVAGEVVPDRRTGQLTAFFEGLPPYPISELRTHLREGARSPLVSPPSCGSHAVTAELTPSADPGSALLLSSSFKVTQGPGGGPCPKGRPFDPGLLAGTLNDTAGTFAPFHLRLTRRDGDQDLTRFDATLPEGLLGKLKGVAKCPDAAIAAAKAKSGREELASPSCPANSRLGGVWGGAGVGSQLTYVPGSVYLAGPVGKAPLSVVGIVPAVAGPFDVGTIVVRQALRLNPVGARVEVDGAASDPIPHILAGIPLRVRDVRVDVDRPSFTLNPTDCDPFATTAQIWGGGADVFSILDDRPVTRHSRFQAANCARLGFKPRLQLRLKGGTKRGAHPALTAVYRPRRGDANVESIQTRLPTSAFLEQAHIRTICTRVQFAAEKCPKGSVYGHVVATTPLLEEPLKGPVYLRSSNNDLPDMVLDLHGLVDVEVAARIDSVRGGIRATFPKAPDAPLTRVVLRMQGAKKGLIVNSTNLCSSTNRARVVLGAQNGKRRSLRPVVKPGGCKGGAQKKRR
ncbi:MAG TPA: hypothetical protein VGB06_10815 [Solirubrobacterales bacterium]|jgi:hypothetical protein